MLFHFDIFNGLFSCCFLVHFCCFIYFWGGGGGGEVYIKTLFLKESFGFLPGVAVWIVEGVSGTKFQQ